FESVSVSVQPGPSVRITIDSTAGAPSRGVFRMKRRTVWRFLADRRVMLFLSPVCKRRHRSLVECIGDTVPPPYTGQVLRIKWMLIDLLIFPYFGAVAVVLAPRTSFPAWRRWGRCSGRYFIVSATPRGFCCIVSIPISVIRVLPVV